MSSFQTDGFLFDDENVDKFNVHGLSDNNVDQILDDAFVVIPNRKNRRGQYLIIGRDKRGRCIAVPIEPTRDRNIWRPITAWPCKAIEEARPAGSRRVLK